MRASEFVTEDLSRRNFLGAMGAGAATAAQAAQPSLKLPKEFNVLSNNPNNEIILQKVAHQSGIRGPELAQFLAQMKHESWDFGKMKEKPQGQDYFARRYDMKHAPATARKLGNTKPGDGQRFHGRGFVQLTGRDNYARASQAIGVDLLKDPDLAANPDVAAKIAVWFWKTRVKPNVQNFADTTAVTRLINPALRGLQDRHANFLDYKRIL